MLRWLNSLFTSKAPLVAPETNRPIGPPPRGFVPPASFSFEEDFYCQQELLPAANLDFLAQEVAKIQTQLAAETSELGFDSCYQRPPVPFPTAELRIPAEELRAVLAATGARRFDRVLVWSDRERRPCPGTYGYGRADQYALLFETRQDLVQRLWLQINHLPEPEQPVLQAMLTELGRRYDLRLMDWDALQLIVLTDAPAVAGHLAQ
jgi:hypothetical protein